MTPRASTPSDLERQKLLAEIRKANAEAAYFEAGVTDYTADAAIKAAEADKMRWEARAAECEARVAEVNRMRLVRQEDFELLGDYYHHVYWFDGDVTQKNVTSCLRILEAWHRQDPTCDMEIRINSLGGSVIHGMSLVDTLTQLSLRGGGTHKITITVRGVAASMAAIILQTADVRLMGRNADLLVHEPSGEAVGDRGDIKDIAKWFDAVSTRIANLFVERSQGKIDLPAFENLWQRRDVYLDAEESLAYGFVDAIG